MGTPVGRWKGNYTLNLPGISGSVLVELTEHDGRIQGRWVVETTYPIENASFDGTILKWSIGIAPMEFRLEGDAAAVIGPPMQKKEGLSEQAAHAHWIRLTREGG